MSSLWNFPLCFQLISVAALVLLEKLSGENGVESAVTGGVSSVLLWRKNTNFGNRENWDGLGGDCSGNIFSFPAYMDRSVVALPASILAKQIILPVNGHFVFQPGLTTLSDSGTCQGGEAKFLRTFRVDWFDPDNWIGNDSLLSSKAIPHVERVPCQYDSVQFPSKSSFNLLISSDVAIRKFFLGDQEQQYTDVAFLMNSQLGKIQFQKAMDTKFATNFSDCRENSVEQKNCICKNYEEKTRAKICSLTSGSCNRPSDIDCPNPILPHGFCCPLCGFHVKIQHKTSFKIIDIKRELESQLKDKSAAYKVHVHVSRYTEEGSHIIFVPLQKNATSFARQLVTIALNKLKSNKDVTDSTLQRSWDDDPSVDKLASGELNGGVVALIVFFVLLLLSGIVFLIYWNKKGYPALTLSSCIARIPTIPFPQFPGRDILGSSNSFAFARFSNERVSSINIGQSRTGEIERAEQVDENAPMDIDMPKITDASAGFGFSNVTYDIIAVGDGAGNGEKVNNDAAGTSFTTATSGEGNNVAGTNENTRPTLLNAEEPIYDDVLEVGEDTSAILQSPSEKKIFEE